MPDHDVRQLFDILDGKPTPEFEVSLRRRLLDLVDAAVDESPTQAGRDPKTEETIIMVDLDAPETPNRRRLMQIVGAIAAATVLMIVVLAATRDSSQPPTPVTTPTVAPTTPSTVDTAAATTTSPPTTPSTTDVPVTSIAPTTVADTTPRGPRTTLPADLSSGAYQLPTAVVPLEFTTTQDWSRVLDFADRVVLGRGQESADGEFLITFDRARDASPETILDGLCTDQAQIGAPTPVTLMGVDAFRAEGTTSTTCPAAAIGGSGFFIGADRTLIVVAAEIDDHVVIIFADAPTASSEEFGAEIDAMVASMRKLD